MIRTHPTRLAAMLAIGCALAIPLGAQTPSPAPTPAQAGKRIFVRCAACHTVDAEARPMLGPHLQGIIGRQAGAVAGFRYTSVLRDKPFAWDEARLDRFLQSPQAMLPGVCLSFTGLPNAQDRAALIAYLKDPTG